MERYCCGQVGKESGAKEKLVPQANRNGLTNGLD